MQIELNEEEKIKKFIDTMRTRDMRLPVNKVFKSEELPLEIGNLAKKLGEEGMPLEFWYDSAVIYCFNLFLRWYIST